MAENTPKILEHATKRVPKKKKVAPRRKNPLSITIKRKGSTLTFETDNLSEIMDDWVDVVDQQIDDLKKKVL